MMNKVLMKFLKKLKNILLVVLAAALLFWVFGLNWSFVFKRRIIGEVVSAEKVDSALAVIASGESKVNPQVFSFSVAIKDRFTEEIFMASSEDRQWAAVQAGNCVVAAFFPYPPWNVTKGGTYHNARLLRNFTSCKEVPSGDGLLTKLGFFFLTH